MADLFPSISDIQSTTRVFMPHETIHHPCDIILVVEDGKGFKAHRRVLSEASPFFEKLLNIDMKESKEGIVRLEMLTEAVLRDILEFVYTGSVQISDDNALDLIAMADYLFLPLLKVPAERFLAQNLRTTCCISTYYFAERYRCEKLMSTTRSFILSNFTTVAKTEEFLNMSSKELIKWISSEQIVINAEEDVFKIILIWINGDKLERKKYFPQLFRQVRLPYVSRDYLRGHIMTNCFVKDDKFCLNLVKGTLKVIDGQVNYTFSVKPRKSLHTPVVVTCLSCMKKRGQILCYFPREDLWCELNGTVPSNSDGVMFSCHGKLYFICRTVEPSLLCYDSVINCWTSLPFNEERRLLQIFVGNENEAYALFCEGRTCEKRRLSTITKYNPKSNSWKDVSSSFDLGEREGICIVAKDNFVYFLGGGKKIPTGGGLYQPITYEPTLTRDADRYDLVKDKWDKMADMRAARWGAKAAIAHEKIFITGGIVPGYHGITKEGFHHFGIRFNFEMYNEATNEWQSIADLSVPSDSYIQGTMMCIDGQLCVLGVYLDKRAVGQIEAYDPEKNVWSKKTDIPIGRMFSMDILMSCNMIVSMASKFVGKRSSPIDYLSP